MNCAPSQRSRAGNLFAPFEIGRAAAVVALVLAMPGSPVAAQRAGPEARFTALEGLAELEASATAEWDMAITMRGGLTHGEFESDLAREFLVGLESTGVKTADSALGRLECTVRVTLVEDAEPIVVVAWTVRVLRPEDVDEPSGRWRVVWSVGQMETTSPDALSGSEVGGDCAVAFGGAWSRANPRR